MGIHRPLGLGWEGVEGSAGGVGVEGCPRCVETPSSNYY